MAAAAPVFDYDLSKSKYMAYVKKCFDEESTHSEDTIKKTIAALKASEKTHLHKYYEIVFAFGREILTEIRKTPNDPQVQVLSFEDVFDIFIKYHLSNNHRGGRQHLTHVEKQLITLYNYPSVCLSLLVKSCNVCRSKTIKPAKTYTKICSVYITLMIQKETRVNCKYLLIYIDKSTDFVVIRPLCQKLDTEVAMEIFKILMQFGPPKKLCMYGHNKDFNIKVGLHLRQVCPMFNFSIEYRSSNLDPSAYVVNKVHEWMSENNSISWEIGCSAVQKELNMIRLKSRTGENENITPFQLLYDRKGITNPISTEMANMYSKCGQVSEMRFKTKEEENTSDKTLQIENPEVVVIEDDVVELRIPNTENYNQDLLSQFEDSEASQKNGVELQTDIIKLELEEMVVDENENKGKDEVVDDPVLCLDLEVDDGQSASEEEDEMELSESDSAEDFDTRRSLRIVKKVVDTATQWIEEKDEVADEDILDVKEDPLNMGEDDIELD